MGFDIGLIIFELNELVRDEIVESYALGGAVAANIYVESATTEDVDVFVIFKHQAGPLIDPSPVFDYLKNRGYSMDGDRVTIGGWPVQFLPPPGSLEDEAMECAIILEDDEGSLRVFSPEHLAAVALKTGRPKDFARLLQFLDYPKLDIQVFESIIFRHQLTEKWLEFKNRFGPYTHET